jgi:membrane protein
VRTVRRVRAAAEGAARTAPPPLVRFVTRAAGALRDIEPFDRAMSLAAQAFTGLFPLLIAVAVLLPHDPDEVVDGISDSLSLPASTRTVIEQLLPQQSGSRGLFGVAGLFITLISATSFSRALARMYGRVWGVRPTGWGTGAWRWVAALVGVALFAVVIRFLRAVIGGTVVATLGQLVTTMILGTLLWTWVPWLLLRRQVGWRWLLPGGLLMGTGMVGTSLASGVYLPRALVSTSRQFGALGVAFTYIGWLFVVASVLVAATVVGEVLARDPIVVRYLGSAPSAPRTPPR